MNKLFTKIATAMVGIAMAVGVGVAVGSKGAAREARAANYTYSGKTGNYSGDWSYTTAANGGTAPSDTRLYAKNQITLTADSSKYFVSVVFNLTINKNNSNKFPTSAETSSGTVSGYPNTYGSNKSFTVTPASNCSSFTVTVGGTAGNWEISSFDITFVSSGNTRTDVTVSLGNAPSTLKIGGSYTLVPTAKNASNVDVTSSLSFSYSSGSTSVATVTSAGLISAVTKGKTAITVSWAQTNDYNAGSITHNLTVNETNTVIDLDFPVLGQSDNNNYTGTWTAPNGGYSVSLSAVNNGGESSWSEVRLGRKDYASTPTITTPQISERITSVVISFTQVKNTKTNSAVLKVANNSDFTNAEEFDFKNDISVGNVTISIPKNKSAVNLYYQIAFDLANDGSDNGFIRISEIQFIAVPVVTLDSFAITGVPTTYYAGSPFSIGSSYTATATYSNSTQTHPTSGFTYTLSGSAITAGSTIPTTAVGTNKTLTVTYTDENDESATATINNVTVNYKATSSVTLDKNAVELAVSGMLASTTLTATISDQYADPTIKWLTSNDEIVDLDTTSTQSGASNTIVAFGAGTATITAFSDANGNNNWDQGEEKATCAVTVSDEASIGIVYSGTSTEVTGTINKFTGDAGFELDAVQASFDTSTIVYDWNSSDTSVATIESDEDYCQVSIVGAGSTTISVNATDNSGHDETASFTLSVAQSGVTALSLTSSVEGGELYDGDYLKTLTLTPNITKQGNATSLINWSSSDTGVATVSSAQTDGTLITVTAVAPGTTTITAASVYTPATSVTYTVKVNAEGVKQLTWASKPTLSGDNKIYVNYTTLGEAITAGGGYGTFTAKWNSGKEDTHPVYGTTEGTVHFGLYSSSNPESEGTALATSYKFQKTDNGKYLVPFYEGKRCSHYVQISVINWRSVIVSNTSTATYDFTSITETSTSEMGSIDDYYVDSSTLANGDTYISKIYPEADVGIKGGSSKANGTITITFAESVEISAVKFTAKQYSGTENTLTVMGKSQTLTDTLTEYTFSVENEDFEATNEVTISGSKRFYMSKLEIIAGGDQEIGRTADCLGLEAFIDQYLHMSDYPGTEGQAGQGWCKDGEHNYYGKNTETGAKYAFNHLNSHQRELFTTNEAYLAEYKRLAAWALANGESLISSEDEDDDNTFGKNANPLISSFSEGSTTTAVIIISVVSVAALGGYFFLRRRKEQ